MSFNPQMIHDRLHGWVTPSILKSIIQKIIRTRCRTVRWLDDTTSDAELTLRTVIEMLIRHPGSFVPNIQRYVTGVESAAKRVAISIMEDGYTTRFDVLMDMMASALVAQRYPQWRPSDTQVEMWKDVAIASLRSPYMFSYSSREVLPVNPPFVPVHNQVPERLPTHLEMTYLLLREIRSFAGDIALAYSIAKRHGRAEQLIVHGTVRDVMHIEHAIDNHCCPEIGYWLPYTNGGISEAFKRLWDVASSVKGTVPYIPDIVEAQRTVWFLRSVPSKERVSVPVRSDRITTINYVLDRSWLAGLVGTIEIKLQRARGYAYAVMHTERIMDITAVRKPSRNKDLGQLDDDDMQYVRGEAYALLKKGIMLKNVPSTLPWLRNATVYLRDDVDDYVLMLSDGTVTTWDAWRDLTVELPFMNTERTPYNPVTMRCDGIHPDAFTMLRDRVQRLPRRRETLQRLLTFLAAKRSTISMHKLSRDGYGQEYAVVPYDVDVYSVIVEIATLFPGALQITSNGTFNVLNGPVIWKIYETLRSYFSTYALSVSGWRNTVNNVASRRLLWEHQRDAVQQMTDRSDKGYRGNLVWIPVGMGKTLIVMRFLEHLRQNQQLPPYIVYSLPPSALDSVQREIRKEGYPVHEIDTRKTHIQRDGTHPYTLKPYTVNMVRHDQMRQPRLSQQLRQHASETVFIIDEFHLTLNKTLRTSIALDIARLSYRFVGMTGTLIKDTNVTDLIQWLEQVTHFEVTEDNFWVAVGSIVSRRVATHVVVRRLALEAVLTPEQKRKYASAVPPRLGGYAQQMDFSTAAKISFEATLGGILRVALCALKVGQKPFIVAKDSAAQETIYRVLSQSIGRRHVAIVDKNTSLTLEYGTDNPIRAVITTPLHSTGYTLTALDTMITGVYFGNQATREQLEGRINRIGQQRESVDFYTVHAGILSYVYARYETARSLSQVLKGFSKEIDL